MPRTRIVVDCATGEAQDMEMTDADEAACAATQADLQAQQAASAAAQAVRAGAVDAIRTHVAANPDDPTALLAKALGMA